MCRRLLALCLTTLLLVPETSAQQESEDIDDRCSEKRPFWSTTYLTCLQCRTSADCPKQGDVCYSGDCSSTCPPGSYKTMERLNPEYYISLDEALNTEDIWVAFNDDESSKMKEKVRSQFEDFNKKYKKQFFEDSEYPSKDGQLMPVCQCSEEAKYKKSTSSWTLGTVPGHPFSEVCACDSSTGYCEGYINIAFIGGSESLVPKGKPANCWGETQSLRLRLLGLTFVALGIAVFAYRSSSNILSDFHRMNLFNIICTWIFVLMYMIDDPHQGGYSRFLGAGIFLHNAAEWNFMIRLWFGHSLKTRQVISWWGMMFIAIMMILIMLLPLHTQLVLAGTLGAMLDVTFILMSFAMIVRAKENDKPGKTWIRQSFRAGESRFTGLLFLVAFVAHILALQSIFGAMGSGNLTVEIWILAVLFTFFQFILLEMFAYNQDHRAVWCMPYDQSSFDFVPVEHEKHPHRYMLIDNVEATSTANPGIMVKTIVDGEFDSNPEVVRGRPDRLIHDLGVYPDGLNERIKGCKECHCLCASSCCSPKIPPFAVYLSIGFIVALFVNLSLFVFSPQAVDFEDLSIGDCPGYYPIHGNRGVPHWISDMPIDHPFRQKYGEIFWRKISNSLSTIGIVVSLVMFALLLVLIRIQVVYVKNPSEIVTIRENHMWKRSLVSEKIEKTKAPDLSNNPPTTAGDLEMAVTPGASPATKETLAKIWRNSLSAVEMEDSLAKIWRNSLSGAETGPAHHPMEGEI